MNPNEFATVRKVTLVGLWINVALVVAKLFFGYWGRSDALVADGYHSVSDFITDFLVLYFVHKSYRSPDKGHPYGHGKYETVASVLINLVLVVVGLMIGYQGVVTLSMALEGHILPPLDIWTLYVAVFSIVAKEFCYRYTMHYGRKLGSSALKANAWHHRSDAISSVATVVGISLAMFLGQKWRIMDPIASIVIAFLIIIPAVRGARPSVEELLETALPEKTLRRMREVILQVPGVLKVHNLRSRRNGHAYLVDVNIHVDGNQTVRQGHNIATEVEHRLRSQFHHEMIIYVHVEPQDNTRQAAPDPFDPAHPQN